MVFSSGLLFFRDRFCSIVVIDKTLYLKKGYKPSLFILFRCIERFAICAVNIDIE
jgi:hypothetical protein